MDTQGQAAPVLRPATDTRRAPPQRTTAPQSWMVRIVDAQYYWPDLHDPAGHQLLLAVTRPRVRFDVTGMVQWGFSSLKLTLPLLRGAEQSKDHITVELRMPPNASAKKPGVALSATEIRLNWGNLVEVLSVHDLLRLYGHTHTLPSKVFHVGRTPRPPLIEGYDTLLLAIDTEVQVNCADGDPADGADDPDALRAERTDMIEAALIRYFEGSAPRQRSDGERQARSARLLAIQAANHLVQYTIDLALPGCGHYQQLCSAFVTAAERHLLSCFIADGQVQVASMPFQPG